MISPESRTKEWIGSVSKKHKANNIGLVEKTIRAFSLLEALQRSGCPLVFKGGSCLMLHFNTEKRLSIDIDIICPPGTRIEDYWNRFTTEYGFQEPELVDRKARIDVPKRHAKFNYQVAFSNDRTDKILLDVLLEDAPYENIEQLPIRSPFLKTEGDDILVNVPSKQDILGDKLAAFAPNTTGIPYFKRERDCSMEICKQMFDVACLIDSIDNYNNVIDVYKKNVDIELEYRSMQQKSFSDVLQDTIDTSLCLASRGTFNNESFKLLSNGVARLQNFIFGSRYSIENAIADSAKIAYLCACMQRQTANVFQKYDSSRINNLRNVEIDSSMDSDKFKWTKLNKLKKSNIEAFYYWQKTFDILKG